MPPNNIHQSETRAETVKTGVGEGKTDNAMYCYCDCSTNCDLCVRLDISRPTIPAADQCSGLHNNICPLCSTQMSQRSPPSHSIKDTFPSFLKTFGMFNMNISNNMNI